MIIFEYRPNGCGRGWTFGRKFIRIKKLSLKDQLEDKTVYEYEDETVKLYRTEKGIIHRI